MAYRRTTTQVHGVAAGPLLLVAVVLGAAGVGGEAEAVWPCDAVQSSSTPWHAPSVWWEAGGNYYTQLRSEDPGAGGRALQLRSVLRLYPLAQRDAESSACAQASEAVTQVCVALGDTTAYSSDGAEENVAWVTLHTDPLQPVAVVEVDAACWERERSSLSRCQPCLLAPPQMQQLPLYRHSPLSRAFWEALSSDAMPHAASANTSAPAPRRPWLHRINMQANANRSARAEWLRLARVPTLRGLELTGNAWADTVPVLPPLPALGELRLHDNGLTALPDDYLIGSPLLQTLVLARNSLTSLPQSITNMKMLRLLDVTNPLPLGQTFSVENIPVLPNLRILGLENQKLIGDITSVMMIPSLMFLNMSGCGLKDLGKPSRFHQHSTDLQVLDLSYNNIEVLSNSILSRYPKLTKFSLNGNNLRIFGDGNSLLLPALDYLDISHNHLKMLPVVESNSKLKTLKARDNVLENFNENFWDGFPLIETIDLSQNQLTEVPVLKHQEHLQSLDLSENEIKLVNGLNFGYLRNLKSIVISKNLITIVDPNVFPHFQELKTLDLSHNRLWHINITSESVELVDLSFNLLTDFPVLNAPSLYRLSLKRNLISSLNFTLMNARKLRELDVSWNSITVAELGNLTFDEVDLSHNSLGFMPTGSHGTHNIKVEGNPFNGAEIKNEAGNAMWGSWYMWILVGIVTLTVITILLLIGVSLLVKKLMKRSEPLVLSSIRRSPSIASLSDTSVVRFKECS